MSDRNEQLHPDSPAPDASKPLDAADTVDLVELPDMAGMSLGPYRLIRKIGEGGMGFVYEADQTHPIRRTVALKIVKPGMDSQRVITRFQTESNALALMDHPNIASVLEAGVAEGNRPYFVMELVAGLPITEFCDQRKLGVRERAKLMVTVCRAVQHAHQKGIIHRDLKPSNVLVADLDGVATPKVIDFGVAKAIEANALQEGQTTQFGHAVGTPLYMSPEQARLANSDVDTRSDVYSLGVLFYELLTSTTPVRRERLGEMDLHELRHVIRKEEPPRPSGRLRELGQDLGPVAGARGTDPRGLVQAVRGDLDQIVGRALAKDRSLRYPTANGLARDIERYLDHRPIEASSPSQWYRLRRFARRHRAALATGLLFAAVLFLAAAAGIWQAHRTARALRMAESAALRLSELLYVSDINLASDAWQDNDPPRVAGLLERHLPTREAPDFRHFEWYYLSRLVDVARVEIDVAVDDVETIRFAPDGRFFAAAGRDGRIRIYDARSLAAVCRMEAGQGAINDLAFSPDSRTLVSAGQDGSLILWGWDGRRLARQRAIAAHAEAARGVAFAEQGRWLVSCGLDKQVCIWDAKDGTPIDPLPGHTRGVEAVAVSPDGRTLISAGNDGTLRVWDLQRRSHVRTFQHSSARVVCVACSADGRLAAAGDINGNLILCSLEQGSSRILATQLDGIESVVFLKGGAWLATGDRGGSIQLWPLGDDEAAQIPAGAANPRWQADRSRITALSLDPHGERLISGSRSGRIRGWAAEPLPCRWSPGGTGQPYLDFAFAGPDRLLVAADTAGIEVWDLDTRARTTRWGTGQNAWQKVAVSLSRNVAVTGDAAGQLVAWDLATRQPLHRWSAPDFVAWERIEFADDGNRFAVAAWDRQPLARVFCLDAPDSQRQVAAKQSKCVAFHPQHDRLAVAWEDDAVVYRGSDRSVQRRYQGHENTLSDLAFSPDGRWLATVSHDRKLRLWSADSADQRYAIVAHKGWIRSLCFSPDGWSLATAGEDGVVKIWHVASGQRLLVLPDEGSPVHKVRFSPDGRRIACLTHDQRIVLYDSLP